MCTYLFWMYSNFLWWWVWCLWVKCLRGLYWLLRAIEGEPKLCKPLSSGRLNGSRARFWKILSLNELNGSRASFWTITHLYSSYSSSFFYTQNNKTTKYPTKATNNWMWQTSVIQSITWNKMFSHCFIYVYLHVITCFHVLCFRVFSCAIICFHKFSCVFTCFHIYSSNVFFCQY